MSLADLDPAQLSISLLVILFWFGSLTQGSQCSTDWPGTQYVDQAVFKLVAILLPTWECFFLRQGFVMYLPTSYVEQTALKLVLRM